MIQCWSALSREQEGLPRYAFPTGRRVGALPDVHLYVWPFFFSHLGRFEGTVLPPLGQTVGRAPPNA